MVFPYICRAVLISVLCACAASPSIAAERVVAYVTGWEKPPDIPAAKLTHINYAFARIDAEGQAILPHPGAAGNLALLRSLKVKNPELKILISVGGWEAEGFSDAAVSKASREKFARSVVMLLREHSLDGVDLDWEYPGQSVSGIKSRPQDKQNFTALLREVRAQLGDRYLRRLPPPIASTSSSRRWTGCTSISTGST